MCHRSAVQFLCDRNAVGIHAFNPPLLGAYVKPLCYFESAADELQRLGVRRVSMRLRDVNSLPTRC